MLFYLSLQRYSFIKSIFIVDFSLCVYYGVLRWSPKFKVKVLNFRSICPKLGKHLYNQFLRCFLQWDFWAKQTFLEFRNIFDAISKKVPENISCCLFQYIVNRYDESLLSIILILLWQFNNSEKNIELSLREWKLKLRNTEFSPITVLYTL